MITGYSKFIDRLKNKDFTDMDQRFIHPVLKINFLLISTQNEIADEIKLNINKSDFIAIDIYTISDTDYFIFCFSEHLIIINNTDKSLIKGLFEPDIDTNKIFFIKSPKNSLSEVFDFQINKPNNHSIPAEEIENFALKFLLLPKKDPSYKFWAAISPCLSAYLLHKSYLKCKIDRISDFFSNIENLIDIKEETFKPDDFIDIKRIGKGSNTIIDLKYHIRNEQLYIIKSRTDGDKLYLREITNYKSIHFPLLSRFYGKIDQWDKNNMVVEYIHGNTLFNIQTLKLDISQKVEIIVNILYIFKYLHSQQFVYRDLKPNNVILDANNRVILIDFDAMIKDSSIVNNNNSTTDFSHQFIAPELINGSKPTLKNDIYSITKMIYYILFENIAINETAELETNFPLFYKMIYKQNIQIDTESRQSISELIYNITKYFINIQDLDDGFKKQIIQYDEKKFIRNINSILVIHENIESIINLLPNNLDVSDKETQFVLGKIYFEGEYTPHNFDKGVECLTNAAKLGHIQAQYYLGILYYENKYISQDINKAIHYFKLAADQNHPSAQYYLGSIYNEDKFISRDIKKAIHYFTLAANQNNSDLQNALGIIYMEEKNINKAIHYFTLAANQNNVGSQFNLGKVYIEGKYANRDISKAIHYLSLAANNNCPNAQFLLGVIYYECKYVAQDIDKSIIYFTLAANQNFKDAQYNLGNIYYESEYVNRDINKAIHYLSLAANNNCQHAQFKLGAIYFEGKYVTRDIKQSIHYFTLAANQGNLTAQYNLGNIYLKGRYTTQDIGKAIYYLTNVANANNIEVQNFLGDIYYNGKYVSQDINKAIKYYTQAADQNNQYAQFNLGTIYCVGEYVTRDMNKAIHYLTLSANQNNHNSQFNLGQIYYENKCIDKAVHYFTLAANQNNSYAQFYLGYIYYEGIYLPRDIDLAIHFLTLSANQNNPEAQFCLGTIYYNGFLVAQDVIKALNYFELAAKQNHPNSQYAIGYIYFNGAFITQDIAKGIDCITLAAKQGYPKAQFDLGTICIKGKHVTRDINKGIDYYLRAAYQNHPESLFKLSTYYFKGKYVTQDIKKSLYYLRLSANNNFIKAKLYLGDFYLEGKYIEHNIDAAFRLYKDSLIHFNSHAKNNLGVIYMKKYNNYQQAKIYFDESINRSSDPLPYYNMACLILSEEENQFQNFKEAVKLLVYSYFRHFSQAQDLLHLLFIKKCGSNQKDVVLKEIIDYFKKVKYSEYSFEFLENTIIQSLSAKLEESQTYLDNAEYVESLYRDTITNAFAYIRKKHFSLKVIGEDLELKKLNSIPKMPNINDMFYQGLGDDIPNII